MRPTTELENRGEIETGTVFEQQGYLESYETGEQLPIRRVEVQLKTPIGFIDGRSRIGLGGKNETGRNRGVPARTRKIRPI